MNKLKVIVTGATGMVGEGVLYECLHHPEVEKVLVITRRTSGYSHPKLTEIIHRDFFDLSSLDDSLNGYNACYFCLGVTSIGKNEEEYSKLTHDLTLGFATKLSSLNPEMTFCYISGAGSDASAKGKRMWAHVKGQTENDLMKLPFKQVYNFRPGFIKPFLPLKPSQTYYKTYKYMGWLMALMQVIAPGMVIRLKDLAAAMINVSIAGYSKNILEMKDMKILAKAKA